ILRVRIPLASGRESRFRKIGTRRAQAISKVVIALSWRDTVGGAAGAAGAAGVVGAPGSNGAWHDLRLALGSVAERPIRARGARQAAIDGGVDLDVDPATEGIRASDWVVPAAPAALADRRVEITGPAEPKMMINAFNSGARIFMADLEDALSPTWSNVVGGQ